MESKVNENDRYGRRWNLRLYGIAEISEENINARVKDICRAIVPEEERNVAGSLDAVHRLGRLRDGENKQPATTTSDHEIHLQDSEGYDMEKCKEKLLFKKRTN